MGIEQPAIHLSPLCTPRLLHSGTTMWVLMLLPIRVPGREFVMLVRLLDPVKGAVLEVVHRTPTAPSSLRKKGGHVKSGWGCKGFCFLPRGVIGEGSCFRESPNALGLDGAASSNTDWEVSGIGESSPGSYMYASTGDNVA